MRKILFTLLAALALAGCTTVTICREGGRNTVSIENSGWYLFTCLPIASGNPLTPEDDSVFFTDAVTIEGNVMLLNRTVRAENAARAENITSYITDENVFIFLLSRHVCHTSAELIMEKAK